MSSAGQQSPTVADSAAPASALPASDRHETPLERRGGRLRVRPVPASYRPRTSRAEAVEAFKAQHVFPQTAERETADVRLGLYSSDRLRMTLPAVYLDQPAWVIRYDNVPAEANPGALGSTGSAQPVKAEDGPVNILVFIDADTGRYLNAVQDPVTAG
ncbi:MAG: hypothetical protein ACRDYF_15750 [Acidimicrobiia bacterium]